MDWFGILNVVSHELRSPTAVISGYSRMLREGQLDEDDRLRALTQIERAASRLMVMGQQAAQLARWLQPADAVRDVEISVRDLLTSALARTASPERIEIEFDRASNAMRVRSPDCHSLSAALGAVVDAVTREVAEDGIRVLVSTAGRPAACDIRIGAASRLRGESAAIGPEAGDTVSLERGGQGLAFVLATVVLAAHRARLWTEGGEDIVGIRLPECSCVRD